MLLFVLGKVVDDDPVMGVFDFLTPQSSHVSDVALLEKKQIEHAHMLPPPLLIIVLSGPVWLVMMSFVAAVVSILMIIFGDDRRNPPYIFLRREI